jgi:hypothetical protein
VGSERYQINQIKTKAEKKPRQNEAGKESGGEYNKPEAGDIG